jgi:hypothetical protein
MIPLWFRLTCWITLFTIIFFFIKNLIRDMKICPICKKRMWFWQEVYFRKEKIQIFGRKKDTLIPETHARCSDGF